MAINVVRFSHKYAAFVNNPTAAEGAMAINVVPALDQLHGIRAEPLQLCD
jgi:hypothetical protein